MSSSLKLSNSAVSTLAAGLVVDSTSVTLLPGTGVRFPSLSSGQWFPATIIRVDGTFEIVRVTARAVDVLTVVRAQDGTAAGIFDAGDRFELRLTAGAITDELARIDTEIGGFSDQVADAVAAAQQVIMVGGIIMFTGTDPGAGWALCDGSTVARSDGTGVIATPDLRGRFIVGAGGAYAVGNTGGADTVALSAAQLPSHSHTGSGTTSGFSNDHSHGFSGSTSGVGDHAHSYFGLQSVGSGNITDSSIESSTASGTFSTGGAGAHSHTFSGSTGGASASHTHTYSFTTSAVGSGSAHENRPPYYALAFIMKV